ncbi:MAG: AI-2E family transporter [Candidatus Gastranaerophilales bacterium]|nr:AI-2E family transporter [Candidatus Gastranaerophilales bacterium]
MDQKQPKNHQFILFSVMTIVFLILIYVFKEIALLFFGSYVVACALSPLVDMMAKVMPRWLAISVVYLLGIITILLLAIPLCVLAIEESALFLHNLPVYGSYVKNLIMDISKVDIPAKALVFNFNTISEASTKLGTEIFNQSINLTKNIIEGITILFTASIIVLYMLLDKPILKDGILSFFPDRLKDKVHQMARTISYKVGGYVIGQILVMIAVGILTGLGLFLLKIKYAALLGLLAGVLDIVPIAGPIIAFMLGALVAAPLGPKAVISVLVVYSLAQWVTNQFMKPAMFGKLLDLHPIVIILAILIAAQTLGVIGVILSPAIAATICVIFQEFYLKVINKKEND